MAAAVSKKSRIASSRLALSQRLTDSLGHRKFGPLQSMDVIPRNAFENETFRALLFYLFFEIKGIKGRTPIVLNRSE